MFEGKLGHLFLQLHDNFSPKSQLELLNYLQLLKSTGLPVALELRNTQWFSENSIAQETFATMRELDISTVITDAAGRRDCVHQTLTTPVAFIRFEGNNLHPTDFVRLDEWAIRIKTWMDNGLQNLYFFVHNHEELNSPELCKYFIQALNKHCCLTIPVPTLIYENEQQSLF